ncbi:DNA endonuclease [Siminovitchia sediminis]|uniref:DNA endonuclease n=1 Tax=Siminovitchia sediminis TaxID=1274353 RepID=A0ABW4KIB6_9BACI
MPWDYLSEIQKNVLFASIIGDGEITKLYRNSRRINNSYREHYGISQEDYRYWKKDFFPDLLYITPKSQTLRSKSDPLFTKLYPHFYNAEGNKIIPVQLLPLCKNIHFLAILYMDDGTLSITTTINHRKRLIYLTPHIYLYLQNYQHDDLLLLQNHIRDVFKFNFKLSKRKDGYGFILKFTSVQDTYEFLKSISPVTKTCRTMEYKTNWGVRFQLETNKFQQLYPDYKVIASCSSRSKPYSSEEIKILIKLKTQKHTIQQIADHLNRSYWSVVYKTRELRKSGLLK